MKDNGVEIDIVFSDPPRVRNRQQDVEGKYDAPLSILKQNKNKWARIAVTNNSRKASSLLSIVKNTPRYKNLASPGKFDVVTRRLEDTEKGEKQYGVWMRWVPR